jgi:hypothetical protein
VVTHKAALWLALATAMVSVPAPAVADRGQQGWHGGHRAVPGGHKFHHMHHHQFPHRPYPFRYPGFSYRAPYVYGSGFYGGGVYGGGYYSSPVIYGSAPVYDPPAAYNPPPVYMSVGVGPVAPPPPRASVIEYPTGRYELRGDGFSMPYTWVWIPNPPPPPAEEPEPVPGPALRSAPSSPPASAAPAPRKSQLYRWVDGQGVVHLTDNLENVPEPYRTPAARTRPF